LNYIQLNHVVQLSEDNLLLIGDIAKKESSIENLKEEAEQTKQELANFKQYYETETRLYEETVT
jgi:vacuolar-type H+-ATPase subunit I/STV1